MEEAEATPLGHAQGENSHGTEAREETAIAPAYTAAGTTGRGACSGMWGLRSLGVPRMAAGGSGGFKVSACLKPEAPPSSCCSLKFKAKDLPSFGDASLREAKPPPTNQ